ncbi:MAG: coproporphyrinogen III oxidase [Cyclobacteriaceae bacterium]|jgi:coproporphyrinogen III oxidase
MISKEEIKTWFENLQDEICNGLEELDGNALFEQDIWERPEGGGGKSRVIKNGSLIEKGGVNFSAVHGPTPEKITAALGINKANFFATGVSIVLHPSNPWVPIIHMNVRYFEMEGGEYWFGGGIDLTPHYVDKESGKTIHHYLKHVCDQADSNYYLRFKKWADDYFYIKHRDETRGVGGIFYDRLNEKTEQKSKAELWAFSQSVGKSFLSIYKSYAQESRNKEFSEQHRKWQLIRRGRYAEFNLVWDKGTKFGLDTGGRTESILMSLPPDASWEYNLVPSLGSKEAETMHWLKKDIDWVKNG